MNEVLEDILGADGFDDLIDERRYRHDVYSEEASG